MTKAQRLAEVISRLRQLPSARSGVEARRQLEDTLNAVEDEFSGVPSNPSNWRTDGRLYPPQDDNAADVPGYPHLTSFRSVAHETLISDNGAMLIREAKQTSNVLLERSGADGKGVFE